MKGLKWEPQTGNSDTWYEYDRNITTWIFFSILQIHSHDILGVLCLGSPLKALGCWIRCSVQARNLLAHVMFMSDVGVVIQASTCCDE